LKAQARRPQSSYKELFLQHTMSNCTAAAAVLPTLTYFNTAGRAFPLRVALFKAFGKDGWVDERIMFDQWRALKEKTPLGSLPYLTLGDGITHVAQSEALARWAGRHSGLYPQDPTAALLCDEVCSTAMEILSKCPPAAGEEGKKARDEYSKGFMAKAFGMLESKVQDNGWLVGDGLSETTCRWQILRPTASSTWLRRMTLVTFPARMWTPIPSSKPIVTVS